MAENVLNRQFGIPGVAAFEGGEGGLTKMWDVVSNTAEYGGRILGPKIIDENAKKSMKA